MQKGHVSPKTKKVPYQIVLKEQVFGDVNKTMKPHQKVRSTDNAFLLQYLSERRVQQLPSSDRGRVQWGHHSNEGGDITPGGLMSVQRCVVSFKDRCEHCQV